MSTILVVDDDESIRVWLERDLTTAGHRVLLAATGPEAVEVARPHQLALVATVMIAAAAIDELHECRTESDLTGVALISRAAPLWRSV